MTESSHPGRYPGRGLSPAELRAVRAQIREWRSLMERLAGR